MPRRLPSLTLVVCAALAASGCGDRTTADPTTTTAPVTTATTVTDGAADAERLGADRAEDASGAVSVCGPLTVTRALVPGLRRFDAASERLLVSTLGFPDGPASARAFRDRQAVASEDCDLYLAADADEVRGLAQGGFLYDLTAPAARWSAADGAALRPVLVGRRAFGVPTSGGGAVLVVSVHARNPGGALEVLRHLTGARPADA